ncbi:helix-turn-helix domain-containing protein [Salmonella enterica]|uniref:helix-turn-helix domain-containing protein n=1 Tax=Salmonella enterica TaxID=28901 RepID=UPI00193D4138|nr:helix-turn-helix domain-containing protein [Salmonella enterica]EEN5589313.1 bacteriophage CI repressor [Salmonella enterica subsp. enterica serovar Mountpleasant]
MNKKSLSEVLNRLMIVFEANNDSELARALGVNRQTLASWRKRDSIPYSLCISVAEQHSVSLDWLLSGTGERGRELSISPRDCTSCHRIMDEISPKTLKWVEMFESLDEEGQKNILKDIEKEQQQAELRQELKGLKEIVEHLKNTG